MFYLLFSIYICYRHQEKGLPVRRYDKRVLVTIKKAAVSFREIL